ncbi:hypothetical protein P692DRAFT_20915669, partial [Suillus brevipes Sb2]
MHHDEAPAADSIASVTGQLPRNSSRLFFRIFFIGLLVSVPLISWWCRTSKNSTPASDVRWSRSGHVCNHRLCKRLKLSEPARRY